MPSGHGISGIIGDLYGNAIAGVTVSCTGQSDTTTSSDGSYSFSGLDDGTYTVTPSYAGHTFTPPNKVVMISGADFIYGGFGALPPTNTISGSLGLKGAGAVVFFLETTDGVFIQFGVAVADSSGNFTSSPLPNNTTYQVIPVVYGAEFSPFLKTVILGVSDITGINWPGPSAYWALVDPSIVDLLSRPALENPLTAWTTFSSGYTDLQSTGSVCEGTSTESDAGPSAAYVNGYSGANNCYSRVTAAVLTSASDGFTNIIRSDSSFGGGSHGYGTENYGPMGTPYSSAQIVDVAAGAAIYTSPGFINGALGYTFSPTDITLLVYWNGNLYMFLNGVPIGAGAGSGSANAGLAGLVTIPDSSVADVQLVNFAAGAVVPSSGPYSVLGAGVPLGNIILDLDSEGFVVPGVQLGTLA